MKRINKIKYIFTFITSIILFSSSVNALTFSTTITSNTMTVGNSVTITINAKGMAGKFSISTSNGSVASINKTSVWIDNGTDTITVKGNAAGTSVITITPVDVTTYEGVEVSGAQTKTITVNAKQVVQNTTPSTNNSSSGTTKTKSSNNYLQSITVEGLKLDKTFDKEVTEYEVSAPAGTEKIKIYAQLADSTAKVTGTGEVSVSEGLNQFNLEVTAENGSKRTYKLKVTVLEYEPIIVTINGQEYTVIRKYKDLPEISEYFQQQQIKINDSLVDGYYNDTLKYKVIGLKDKSGNKKLYIVNNNKFTLYEEYTFNGKTLSLTNRELTGDYKKTVFTYDGNKINSYQNVKLDILKNTYSLDNNDIEGNQFYLFYAINLENGQEELYQYDNLEKTVQRYNIEVLNMYKERSDKYYMYLLLSILLLGLVIITFSIILITNKKNNKQKFEIKQNRNKIKEEVEEEIPEKKNNQRDEKLENILNNKNKKEKKVNYKYNK